MLTVEELQEKYPNPKKAGRYESGYCVGGALCFLSGVPVAYGFPSEETIATTLRFLNRKLTIAKSFWFASFIVKSNDNGDFKTAYGYVDEALKWH